jgi:hypothetical protein
MNYGSKNLANGVPGLDNLGKIDPDQIVNLDPLRILPGTVDSTEFGFLAGATSNLQAQINNFVNGGVVFEAVAVATANITIATPGAINWDGVTPNIGDSVFLIPVASGGNQTAAAEGGLYTYNGASTPLTRYVGMSTWDAIVGSRVYINEGGTVFGSTAWFNTNNSGGVIGTTAVSYTQMQNNYVAGTNMQLLGNVFSTSLTPSFTSETLTANTNFLVSGTTNTMTFTMSALTAPRVFTLPNANSNAVVPTTVTAGSMVSFIDSLGVQNKAVVIDQVLSSFSASAGTVTNTDSIVQFANKVVGNVGALTPSVVHKTANHQFLVSETTVIMDADALTGTLPAPASVIAGITYTLKLGTGANTGTLAVPVGVKLDGTLDGTFPITGAQNSASAQSDGTLWITV